MVPYDEVSDTVRGLMVPEYAAKSPVGKFSTGDLIHFSTVFCENSVPPLLFAISRNRHSIFR